MQQTKIIVWLTALALLLGTTLFCASNAEAKSYRSSGFKSSTYKSRSYSTPKRNNKTIVNRKTTVIQNNTINQGSSGGGMLSSIVGSTAGSMAGNYLYDSLTEPEQKVEPVEQPEVPVTPVKPPVCPEKFICDFDKGIFVDVESGRIIDYSKPIVE